MKANIMKKIIFSKLWKYGAYCKVENIRFETKGLGRFAWIENGPVVKEVFKNWKALLASIPQEKGLSFWIKWIRGAIIEEYLVMKSR